MTKENRRGYEFSKTTKKELRREVCACCGKSRKEARLTVHHIVAIYIAKRFFPWLAKDWVKSIANAEILCTECHDRVHATTSDYEEARKYLEVLDDVL